MKNIVGTAGKFVKRELVRAALERSQSMKMVNDMTNMDKKIPMKFDDVKETLNIPYINRDEVPLAMDVFEPVREEGTELPVIVTIHGGGLTMGDRKISRPFGRYLAHRGYLVFSLEYRLAPRANVCEELGDVCAGLDKVGDMLVDYNVDFNRIFMAAESAGAYLAFYVTAMKNSEKLQEAIGYEASRMTFKAIGLMSGMFYTNRKDMCGLVLADQIYGDKRTDPNFLQYMNPEHPEIIPNLPPVFLTTSKGDFMNNYSFLMHDALKKAGKPNKFVYYADIKLQHAFTTLQIDNPKAIDSIERMLTYLEEQAALEVERHRNDSVLMEKRSKMFAAMDDGSFNEKKIWKYVEERATLDPRQLKKTAIVDTTREYTYEQMLTEWKRYASVFSALNITGANHSRAAVCGGVCAEPLFAFYGLNMVGTTVSMFSYPDFLPGGKWKEMIKREKITDLLITDMMVMPNLFNEIMREKEALGLRNVILLHTRIGGPCVGPAELVYDEFNHEALKRLPGAVFMDELLKKYADTPIAYGDVTGDSLAIITHTSGTTKGTRKPLPYTDRAVNITASGFKNGFHSYKRGLMGKQLRIGVSFDFSSYLCMCGLANTTLCTGDTLVLTFFGFLHPKFPKAVETYRLNVLFTSGFMVDKWMEREDLKDADFSSLKIFACGGSYMPPEKLRKYKEFVKAHGYKYSIERGYGMSETGGAQLYVPEGNEEDILGYPVPKENFRIEDENDHQFYSVDDGVRTGTMYVASDSLCENTLDGETLFSYTEIDGRNFICTNDLIRVNENGSFSYAGRADRYFVNNDGVRFEPGVVETLMAAQPAVDKCAVVPVLEKRIHDTVPVLYVIPGEKGENAPESIRKALYNVFVESGKTKDTNIPSSFVIVDEIPCNSNGKIDIYRITRDRLSGIAYNITPVREDGKLTDIAIERNDKLNSITAGTLPEGMGTDSAFGVFDLFNVAPKKNNSVKLPFGRELEFNVLGLPKLPLKKTEKKDKKDFEMPQVPDKLMELSTKMTGLMYGAKRYDVDIED